MLSIILLSAAMSIDAMGLGIAFGVRKIRMGITASLIISITAFFVICLAMLAGIGMLSMFSENAGSIISSLILIGMGLWVILQSHEKPESTNNRTLKIIRSPQEGDLDKSGNIDKTEAFFLGLALSLDSIGICIGAGNMSFAYILPPVAMIMQLIFIVLGINLGETLGKYIKAKICTLLSGAIIILIGIWNILSSIF